MTEQRERLRTLATVVVLTMLLLAGPAAAQGLAVIPAFDVSCYSAALGGPASLLLGPAAAQPAGPDGGVADAQANTASVGNGASTGNEGETDRNLTLRELRAQGGIGDDPGGSADHDTVAGGGGGISGTAETAGVSGSQTATVSLNQTVYSEHRGDVATVGISLANTGNATLTIGTVGENNFAQNVTVTDGSGDGFVALEFNTYTAGNSAKAGEGSAVVYSTAASDDEVTNVAASSGVFDPASPGDMTLGVDDYSLSAVAGTEADLANADAAATLSLSKRSTDGVETYVAPGSRRSDLGSASDVLDLQDAGNVTQAATIASGDVFITKIDASGLEGVLKHRTDGGSADATAAFFDEAASDDGAWEFRVVQTNPGPSSDAYVASIDASNAELFPDPSNDDYWLVVATDQVEELTDGDELETNFTTVSDDDINADTATVLDTWDFVTASATIDANADVDNDGDVDEVSVQKAAGQQITGATSVAPGTELSVKVTGTDGGSPFVKPLSAYVSTAGAWSATADFSDNAQGANFDIQVKRGGEWLLDGNEPVDGRIAAAPTGSVTFNDQESFGSAVTVSSVTVSDGGFVAIHLDNNAGKVVGHSNYIEAGSNSDVAIGLNDELGEDTTLVAMPHLDSDGDQTFEFTFGSSVDYPYSENGASVTDSAQITIVEPTPSTTTSESETTTADESETTTADESETTTSCSTPTETETPQQTSTDDGTSVDDTAPTVSSITRASPADPETSASSVEFAVSFSESVENVDSTDFELDTTGSVSGSVSGVSSFSGSSVVVTVDGISGEGSLGLNIASDSDITDQAGNALDRAEPGTDETYSVDTVAPTFAEGASVTTTVEEETTGLALDVQAEDRAGDDTGITYSLAGTDAGLFSIGSATGEVTLDSSQDFEDPGDSDEDGEYELTVEATDTVDNTATQTVTVELTDVNEAPTAEAGEDRTVDEDSPVSFDGTGSTDDDGVTSYEWDWTDDGTYKGSGSTPSHTYADPGTYTVRLRVTDDAGNADTDTVSVTVDDVTDPTADASNSDSSGDEDTAISFDGTASTDNVGVTSYEWNWTADGSYEDTGETPSHTYVDPGTYTVRLRVTDDAGNTDTTTHSVTIADVTDPTADASNSPNAGDEDTAIDFDGTASTDNGNIASYEWDWTADGTYDMTGSNPSHTYADPGTYTVRLRVTDDGGNSDTTTHSVTIADVTDPTADASDSDSTGDEDIAIAFDGTASTDNGDVASYEWDWTDDSTYEDIGETPSHTYADPGTYTVRLRVTDDAGNTDTTTHSVTVTDVTDPTANASNSDSSGDEDTAIVFDGTASTDNGDVASYEWDWTDDGTYDTTGSNPSHTYTTPGAYTVKLRVTDDAGNTDTTTHSVTVYDVTGPTAEAGSYQRVNEDTQVDFNGTGSNDNVGVTSYEWDFDGDNETDASGAQPSHTFDDPGTYVVNLTVTDDAGNTDSDTVTIEVRDTGGSGGSGSDTTPTSTPTATPTPTPTPDSADTSTETPTDTPTPESTDTSTPTATPSPTPTATPTPTPTTGPTSPDTNTGQPPATEDTVAPDTTTTTGPGLGVLAALVALLTLGGLLRRRE